MHAQGSMCHKCAHGDARGAHMHARTVTHAHMHIYTCAHVYTPRLCTPLCMHAHVHTGTGTHTRAHTCTGTLHMCTCIRPACAHRSTSSCAPRQAHTGAWRPSARGNARSESTERRCSLEKEGSRALIASVSRAVSGMGGGSQRLRQVAWESSGEGCDF